ncbi:hypothetical protein EMO92_11300 [Bifidobacterium reuteri]|uniref:Uncharacterized protein n=1 Tax=Bifidobacterium reuteri TaxID=983706 RepID=A0A5J5E0B2_9BIFI|nr:hypothetical protein [Bifidobacterium reuteri]KAA8822249.1 hypothetical protein EMO92_11300 [Bifidobacterium reuteri]
MAKDDQLADLQQQWYERIGSTVNEPMVFDGTRPANLVRDLVELRHERILEGPVTRAYLGRPVAVDPRPVSFKIDDGMGRNIAIIGGGVSPNALDEDQDNNLGIGLVESIGLSLAVSTPAGMARFVVIDCLIDRDREANHVDAWLQTMKALGHDVELVKRRAAIDWIDKSNQLLSQHQETDPPVYVLVFALERCGNLDQAPVTPVAAVPSMGNVPAGNNAGNSTNDSADDWGATDNSNDAWGSLDLSVTSWGSPSSDSNATPREKLLQLFSAGSMENIHMWRYCCFCGWWFVVELLRQ